MPAYRPLRERFGEKYVVRDDGCWEWTAARHEKGYGIIGVGGSRTSRAHRVSWQLHRGPIPAGKLVCHSCDNPACVNPAHLFIGTAKDNSQDMLSKGRCRLPNNRGERASWAKLTAAQARDIATRRMSARRFANLYGVSRSAVFRIWEGKNWSSETCPS